MNMKKTLDIIKRVKEGKIKTLVFANVTERVILYTTFNFTRGICEYEEEYEQTMYYKNVNCNIFATSNAFKMLFKSLRNSSENSDFYLSHTIEYK